MSPLDFTPWDWQRIFLGEVPPSFYLEILLRMAVVYIILMASMRSLGKRMAAQLTRNETAAMVSLAAAIGVPILSPERGLLPPIIIAVIVVCLSRLIAYISAHNQKVEAITQGETDTLVKDAVMDTKTMLKTRITRERILAQLRSNRVNHLGEVKRLYLEANGNFTVVLSDQPKPGLAIFPDDDIEFISELKPGNTLVCHVCGNESKSQSRSEVCSNCSHTKWTPGVTRS
jgi:uncharacterized membrane protein YcaP (DUF421 family)